MAAGDSIAEIETDKVIQNPLDVLKSSSQFVYWPGNCPLHPSRYSARYASDCKSPQALNRLGEPGQQVHCRAAGRGWRQAHVCRTHSP